MPLKLPFMRDQVVSFTPSDASSPDLAALEAHKSVFLAEMDFLKALCLERRRAERSRKDLLLALIREKDSEGERSSDAFAREVLQVRSAISAAVRETDVCGWYSDGSICGIVFTEFNEASRAVVLDKISTKIEQVLQKALGRERAEQVKASFHFYPENRERDKQSSLLDGKLYPDITAREDTARFSRAVKRAIDISGSVVAMALLSPLFALIAIAIKLNSPGPVFFKQLRVGQYGTRFTLLKFRSMTTECDPDIHKEYVRRYIAGREDARQSTAEGKEAFKITQDPRVTKVGRFLRQTSLDELPQIWNVLRGEMSLVGPRPPIPYELDDYDVWHMRRLLEARPGITGLWQVRGRSRTTFDDMVRLDLHYAKTWSLWLDVKILLETPAAVLFGDGAY